MFSDDFLSQIRAVIREELEAQKQGTPAPQNENEKYMSVQETAKYLGVSNWWVYVQSEKNVLPCIRLGQRKRKFLKTDLDVFMRTKSENLPIKASEKTIEAKLETLRKTKRP